MEIREKRKSDWRKSEVILRLDLCPGSHEMPFCGERKRFWLLSSPTAVLLC